jgi:hypothetical protein
MPSAEHQRVVTDLVRTYSLQTKRFMLSVTTAMLGPDFGYHDAHDLRKRHRQYPDAYAVFSTEQIVRAYEVVASTPLTTEKLRQYAELWLELDDYAWDFELIMVDCCDGHYPIDLMRVCFSPPKRLAAAR